MPARRAAMSPDAMARCQRASAMRGAAAQGRVARRDILLILPAARYGVTRYGSATAMAPHVTLMRALFVTRARAAAMPVMPDKEGCCCFFDCRRVSRPPRVFCAATRMPFDIFRRCQMSRLPEMMPPYVMICCRDDAHAMSVRSREMPLYMTARRCGVIHLQAICATFT